MIVIGIDPGPIPGIVRLQMDVNTPGYNLVANGTYLRNAQALQVSPDLIEPVLDMLTAPSDSDRQKRRPVIALERFIVGRRAAQSSTPAAGAITRGMVGAIEAWAERNSVECIARAAADIKPWAVDKRLAATRPVGNPGLLDLTTGMRHARDAARHALFCAVKDYGLPDPLSSKAGTR